MIVTDRFVFLHLHKSGGSFVNRFLMECVPGSQPVGYHLPRDDIPGDARHLPILGTVRNPWDYYVSWYSFQAAMPAPNALFLIASEERRLDFNGTVRNLMRLGEDDSLLSAWVDRLPSERPHRGINLSKTCVAPLAQSGMGFYTFLYRRMYGDRSNTTLLDMAALREGLAKFDGGRGWQDTKLSIDLDKKRIGVGLVPEGSSRARTALSLLVESARDSKRAACSGWPSLRSSARNTSPIAAAFSTMPSSFIASSVATIDAMARGWPE